jgi:phenylalanyl-tRNA synthetase beta subunit
MGFLEIKTFILTNKEKLEISESKGKPLEISNPGSAEYTVVRPNLHAGMLEVFANNKMKGLPQRFYEVGLVSADGAEQERLAFGIMDEKIDFSVARGCLQSLGSEGGLGIELKKEETGLFDKDISCAVFSKGKRIGVFGKVRKEVLGKFGIGFEAYICEMIIG